MVLRKGDEGKISWIYNTELKWNKENQKVGKKHSNKMGTVWHHVEQQKYGELNCRVQEKKSIHDYDEVPGKEID